MSVWVTIPSARPAEQVQAWAQAWKTRGYKIALWRDDCRDATVPTADLLYIGKEYRGYAVAVNTLIAILLGAPKDHAHADAEWFITAGDDVFPDPNHTAEEIAVQCADHFAVRARRGPNAFDNEPTFGVMQPTGDRWGENPNAQNPKMRSAYIDRVCGSAWIGREFAKLINRGKGPLWPEYFHMSVDRELQGVAQKYGVLWQRPDLIHEHRHWGREEPSASNPRGLAYGNNMPAFLKKANEGMVESERLCDQREREGFPGSEPL